MNGNPTQSVIFVTLQVRCDGPLKAETYVS